MIQQNITSKVETPPSNLSYFQLIQLVGSNGKYQKLSIILWCFLWLSTGSLLLGTPFFMYNPPYDCALSIDPLINNQSSQSCQIYVCSLPDFNRTQFIDRNSIVSISNDFNDLHCENAWKSDLLSSLVYIGCFFGYISISIMVDNIGRKRAILISYGIAISGMIISVISPGLYLVGIGFFLMGFGTDSAINICFFFITETLEEKYRQKYSILIQVFFAVGGVIIILQFLLLRNWRIVMAIFLVVPSIISWFIIFKVIKETPYFLIKLRSKEQIFQDLKGIYRLNNRESPSQDHQKQILVLIDTLKIQFAKQQQAISNVSANNSHQKNIVTPLDLFRHKSIRYISIAVCILHLFIYILYYGPLMLIDRFSFNIYINALVVSGSEIITYPISYFFIHRIRRKQIGILLYSIASIIAFSLIFVIYFQCPQCSFLAVLQLILIFIFRFCTSLEFAIFLVFCNEVFPTQIRGLGMGISSAIGTVASSASPYIFGSYITTNWQTSRSMIVFVVISLIGVFIWIRLPQTLNRPIIDKIEQIAQFEKKTQDNQNVKKQGHVELVEINESD